MALNSGIDDCPDVSTQERILRDLIKRVRKRRWIGVEAEALRLEIKLCCGHAVASVETVGICPPGGRFLMDQNAAGIAT